MDSFFITTIAFSWVAGIISVISGILSVYLAYRSEKEKINNAQNEQFEKAIRSDDINELGSFLERNIGDFTVNEYISNSEVSSKVDTYIDRIQQFVSTNKEPLQFDPNKIRRSSPSEQALIKFTPEFEGIIEKFDQGESWGALARLRRVIEIRLKEVAEHNNIAIKKNITAGYLLNLLKRNKVILDPYFSELLYCISVCNNAVHGSDVSISQANEVISIANRVFEELDKGEEKV